MRAAKSVALRAHERADPWDAWSKGEMWVDLWAQLSAGLKVKMTVVLRAVSKGARWAGHSAKLAA